MKLVKFIAPCFLLFPLMAQAATEGFVTLPVPGVTQVARGLQAILGSVSLIGRFVERAS